MADSLVNLTESFVSLLIGSKTLKEHDDLVINHHCVHVH